jgi:hypothetical protein
MRQEEELYLMSTTRKSVMPTKGTRSTINKLVGLIMKKSGDEFLTTRGASEDVGGEN